MPPLIKYDAAIEVAQSEHHAQSDALHEEKRALGDARAHGARVEAELRRVEKRYRNLYSQANAALRAALEVDGAIDSVERSPDATTGDFVGKVLGPPPQLGSRASASARAAVAEGAAAPSYEGEAPLLTLELSGGGGEGDGAAAAELRIKLLKQTHRLEKIVEQGGHAEAMHATKMEAAGAVNDELSAALLHAQREAREYAENGERARHEAEAALRACALEAAQEISSLRVACEGQERENALREEHAVQTQTGADRAMSHLTEQMRDVERRCAAREVEMERSVAEYETQAAEAALAAAEASASLREELNAARAEVCASLPTSAPQRNARCSFSICSPSTRNAHTRAPPFPIPFPSLPLPPVQLRASDQDARTKQATVAELESARVALRASLAAEQQRALRAEQLHATQIELTSAAQTDAEKKGTFGKEETARCAVETEILKRELATIKEEHERKMAFALEEQQRRFVAEVEASNDAQMRDFEAVVSSLRERLAKKSDQTIRLQSELSAANERVDAIAARAEQANLALEEQRRSNEEYVRAHPRARACSLSLSFSVSLSLSLPRSLCLYASACIARARVCWRTSAYI